MGAGDQPDWAAWHDEYDQPGSRLERRLAVVQDQLGRALTNSRSGPLRLLSACAGQGRDVLGVLPDHPRARDVTAVLVETDPQIAAGTADAAQATGMNIGVQVGDAGRASAYASIVPADVALFCGVYGNISSENVARTVRALPSLLALGGRVIWTRGRDQIEDLTVEIRCWFDEAGFIEEAFVAPEDDDFLAGRSSFSVGVHRLRVAPHVYDRDLRLFEFIGYRGVRQLRS